MPDFAALLEFFCLLLHLQTVQCCKTFKWLHISELSDAYSVQCVVDFVIVMLFNNRAFLNCSPFPSFDLFFYFKSLEVCSGPSANIL